MQNNRFVNVITAIVVEDERLPRLALLQKLEQFSMLVQVVDSCDSYQGALESILKNRPQLLFLDIQLQGMNAMNLLDELSKTIPLPYVIFTTAYNEREYLIKAIKLQAVDYLLKPIDRNELAQAIEKVALAISNEAPKVEEKEELKKARYKTSSGDVFIDPESILYVKADGNYSVMITSNNEVMVLESLRNIEQRLGAFPFIRTDRSHIVNMRHVYKINSKRSVVVFQNADGSEKEVMLSKKGIQNLLDNIDS